MKASDRSGLSLERHSFLFHGSVLPAGSRSLVIACRQCCMIAGMLHVTENEADRCYQDGVDLCAVNNRVRVGVGVGLALGLGALELSTADCWRRIPGDRLPVAGGDTGGHQLKAGLTL